MAVLFDFVRISFNLAQIFEHVKKSTLKQESKGQMR